ncbi:vitamin K epoxide reductase family protein [Nocardia panacis]|uniref:vitamin K epoxide reductase family protein n=1 Tax=Nocardia panacis TaxID=2340916 RepID=UPI001EF0C3B8|nr:vitamin K epoxide reductase family protein [Nocardia panacis]
MLILGFAGWSASLTLTIERFRLLTEPGYTPSCSIDPTISCGSIMASPQAAVFGFPNPIIGVVGFSVVVTLGVLAVAGTAVPQWFWGSVALGAGLGVAFVGWLIFQALYRINALCPYCMVVWAATPALLATSARQLWPNSIVVQWRWTLLTVGYVIVAVLVFLRFQDYWLSLL